MSRPQPPIESDPTKENVIMSLVRAIAQFITSEVLLPVTIVCLCVLIAAQLLPMVASSLNGEFDKTITGTGSVASTNVTPSQLGGQGLKP